MLEAFLVIFILVGIIIASVQRPKNYPPGPTPWPLIGNFLDVDFENVQRGQAKFHKRFGGLTGLVFPFHRTLVVNGWEHMKAVLANEDCQGRPDVSLIRDRFDGENFGILFTEGHLWKGQRSFMLQHFRNLGFGRKSHESLVQDEISLLMKDFEAFESRPFSPEYLFYLANLNITWTILSGMRFNHSEPKLHLLADSIRDMIHNVTVAGCPAIIFPFLRYLFPTRSGYSSIKRASKNLREFLQEVIEDHKKTRDPNNPRDFIDIYIHEIENAKPGTSFSEKQLQGICMDLLLAGSDTTASYMSFMVLFLCLRKDIQEMIFQEISSQHGVDRQISIEDRAKLVYTDAYMMEVLRYRAAAPTFPPHRVTKDTVVKGYNLPKGVIIFPDVTSILMDESYWGDPLNFRPERFITDDGKIRKEERLIPFGKGKRSCVGDSLSKMSSFIFLTTLVQNFEISLPEGALVPDTEGVPGFTLAPPKFDIVVKRRSTS